MKKALIAPLCSALVIPGLGQIINEDLKKGATLLALIFIIFVGGIFQLYRLIRALANKSALELSRPSEILTQIESKDVILVWILFSLFLLVWIYSILDAFIRGRKIDLEARDNSQ
jgi:hypothetical protein